MDGDISSQPTHIID